MNDIRMEGRKIRRKGGQRRFTEEGKDRRKEEHVMRGQREGIKELNNKGSEVGRNE